MSSLARRQLLAWMALPALAHAAGRPPEPTAIAGRGWQLVKDWDFTRTVTDLDTLHAEFFTRFIHDQGRLDFLNDEWQRYRDKDNHRFEDGALSLWARASVQPPQRGMIASGMLRSRWSGQYGWFECRMQVPKGRGLWPAFWLHPQDARWPPEIDVVEVVDDGGIGTRQSFHFVHGRAARGALVRRSRLDRWGAFRPGFDLADGFHDFAVLWTPDGVQHFVDGVSVVERRMAWEHDDGSDAGPAHLIVNLAVGGKWPGPPGPGSLPARLRVKHMRVWQPVAAEGGA
jgi:beta-glucanase (GH16 family)